MPAKHTLLKLTIIAILSIVPACSKSNSTDSSTTGGMTGPTASSSTVVLSGTISSTVSATAPGMWRAAGAGTVDKVVGIQVSSIGTAATADPYITAVVDANSKFKMTLDKGGTGGAAVMMLLDTTKTRKIDQVLGFLTVADSATSDSVMSLPTSSAANAVDLGTIAGGSGLSNLSIQDIFSLVGSSIDQMRERGRTDALLRNLKNEWANRGTSITYGYGPGFDWGRSYQDTVNATSWFPVSSYFFKGNLFFFRSNDPALQDAGVCKPSTDASHVAVKLVPPQPFTGSNISTLGATISSETITAFHNDGANTLTLTTCGSSTGGIAGGFFFGKESTGYVNFNWGGGGIRSDNLPSGIWSLMVGSEEKASFDIKATSPVDDAGHYKVYLPSIKVIADSTSFVIQYIEVLFHVWNGTAYVPITDPSLLLSQVNFLGLSLADHWTPSGTPNSTNMTLIHQGSGVFRATPSVPFRTGQFDSNTNADVAASIVINYNLHGVGIAFDLRWY